MTIERNTNRSPHRISDSRRMCELRRLIYVPADVNGERSYESKRQVPSPGGACWLVKQTIYEQREDCT